ncbi:hypothetical protein [Variovorax sp. UMC13]|uniref:hypothetical protein n=1 Tax=Variovorax sp. UMC13 TaxID=1862326 RepID=UPI001C81B8C5|nr:hypothetical protein [Variovorax sp. UMC13]
MNNETGSVEVAVEFVDGSRRDFTQPVGILATHERLAHRGLQGKALVDCLFGDDWGPAPVRVTFTYQGDGETHSFDIRYE